MKKPENFTAGATKRKIDPLVQAISNNFSNSERQISMESPLTPPVSDAVLPTKSDLQDEPVQQQETGGKEKKEKFLLSMAKGERASCKAFCAMKGISMNHFIMCAMDYFREDIEAGKVIITQHSYKRK